MLSARLLARAPSARVMGTAVLRRHGIRWHKLGADGSGKCNVVPVDAAAACVHGVLYQIAQEHKSLLDAAEDLGVGYADRQVVVETRDGRVTAWAYLALKTDAMAVPFDWYRALVVAGALEHALPADYVQELEAAPAQPDDDARRSALHFALIRSGQPHI